MKGGIIVGVAVVSFFALVVLGQVHPFGDPRSEPAQGLGTLLQSANMPAPAKEVLVAKCADCHSSETHWPAYARVAPGSWLIERDIIEGRRHMDLSRWAELSPDKQDVLKAKIVQEAKSGGMPLPQYLLIHWSAKLSKDDVQALALLGKVDGTIEAGAAGAGDAGRGKQVFEKRCTGCHAMEADREGPRLAGIFGRRAGSVTGYTYSAGLRKSGETGLSWDDVSLDKWLSDTDAMVPDNNMEFRVPKPQERLDLIAYLKQAK